MYRPIVHRNVDGCDAGEMAHERLQLMSGGTSMSDYYDLRMNPLLVQLAIAAGSLLVVIVIVTFCCCIEIRRWTPVIPPCLSVRNCDVSRDTSRDGSMVSDALGKIFRLCPHVFRYAHLRYFCFPLPSLVPSSLGALAGSCPSGLLLDLPLLRKFKRSPLISLY